ncbi:haloacid dehalogenase-like hydrolase [Patescibacteria group bacterium]|nr:haloacid dehalogenase-like hydrolase [Patescibacteria group bacterium]
MSKKCWGVVFDCDGTLFNKNIGSLMKLFDERALPQHGRDQAIELRDLYLPQALAGELSVRDELDWLAQTLDIYVDCRVTNKQVRALMADIRVRVGVTECLSELHARNVAVAIVSYGVRPLIVEAMIANGLQDAFDEIYAANLTANRVGRFVSHSRRTYVIPDNKGRWSRQFAKKHNVSLHRLLAVGDSAGDVKLGHFKKNRLGIAESVDEANKIRRYMGDTVVSQDFHSVTAWLLQKIDLQQTPRV